MAKKAAAARVTLEDLPNGQPFLKQGNNGVWAIYYAGKNKAGNDVAKRFVLNVRVLETAEKKFEAWRKKNGYGSASNSKEIALAPQHNDRKPKTLPGETPEEAEARRAKSREYYYRAREKNGNGHAPQNSRNSGDNKAMIRAAVASLASTMQSMSATLKLLNMALGEDASG